MELERPTAYQYAWEKHQGQTYPRKDTEWAYMTHCIRVAEPFVETPLYAPALLHDVVEDTDATITEIVKSFDAKTAEIVEALTRSEGETYTEYIERVKRNEDATAIKLVDLADNLMHCLRPDAPEFTHSLIDRYLKAIRQLAL